MGSFMPAGVVFVLATLVAVHPGDAAEFYVSGVGNDAWSGTLAKPTMDGSDGPFATLERARDALRALKQTQGGLPAGGVTVWIRQGDYVRTRTFLLTAEDSGTREAPITYRARQGKRVRFLGGRAITGFAPVTDLAILERLDEAARAHVMLVDLAAQGISDYGTVRARGFGRAIQPAALELFFNGAPMTLARWPNEDWARIASVPEGQEGVFVYEGDRPKRWSNIGDIWLHGYWTWPWADSHERVKAIDAEMRTISTEPPHGVYGYKAGGRFYAQNVLEELDQPGEWYLDRTAGVLYFWPPEPIKGAEVLVSELEAPFITMDNVSYVTLRGFTFECSRGAGLVMRGGAWNRVAGCTFANLGTLAVNIGSLMPTERGETQDGGSRNGVVSCNIFNTGEGGISVTGGDRATLAPGSNYAVNNDIHHYSRWVRTYRPGVSVSGVRNRVAHNLIHDAPHIAVMFSGNEHVIEFNRVHHVCMETSDAGAFYTGRDWTWRKNVVRYNFLYELGHGDVQAIYLDDWTSDTIVYGNICYKAGRGVLIGGGRDNVVENNIFVECTPAIHIDQRGLGWAKNYFDGTTNTLFERLDAVNHDEPPYSKRYPQLVTLLNDGPAHAKYNHILRNVFYRGRWLDLADGLTEAGVDVADNWTEGDPGFVDAEHLNFQLRDDSPAYALGFERIPAEKIGLYADEFRTPGSIRDGADGNEDTALSRGKAASCRCYSRTRSGLVRPLANVRNVVTGTRPPRSP